MNDARLLDTDPASAIRAASSVPGAAALASEIARLDTTIAQQAAALMQPADEAAHFRRSLLAGVAPAVRTSSAPPPPLDIVVDGLPLTLTGQAAALQAGRLSSLDLVDAALARAQAWQPRLNAFISLEPEDARAAARSADDRRATGQVRGRLDGVPLAHKDMFDRAGRVATGGSEILRGVVASSTSTVASRLDAAGAIWLGGLNMSEFAASPTGLNPHYGPARNPWNTGYITGGSSSGSGAATGARIVGAALGSDTGGSVRLPAAICGVVGLRPTYGTVSRAGALPRATTLDTIGPLGATALDCALLLDAVAGPDAADPTTLDRVPGLADALAVDPATLTVAILDPADLPEMPSDLVACFERAKADLARLGVRTVPARMGWMAEVFALADAISKCEAAAIHERWARERPQDYSAFVFARTLAGYHLPAIRYIEALSLRGRYLERFLGDVLGGADMLFLPTTPIRVPQMDAVDVAAGEEVRQVIFGLSCLTRPFSYIGVPALSVPCGVDQDGLPVGFQLAGRPGTDAVLLGLAHRYQAVTSWAQRTPA